MFASPQALVDVDDWYTRAKALLRSTQLGLGSSQGEVVPSHRGNKDSDGDRGGGLTARDAVSFHYVSEMEARVLHGLLLSPGRVALTPPQLAAMWPGSGKQAGAYSRGLARRGGGGGPDLALAASLLDYLQALRVGGDDSLG